MSHYQNLSEDVDAHSLAWDTINRPERGPNYQPWREFWPPVNAANLTRAELKAKPWLVWKRDASNPNEKPWYHWCNIFEGEVDVPCKNTESFDCRYCNGKGCHVCTTVAEGG
ncbi:hypothetical protein N5P37_000149 [Trichoderma harzianum]|uniref:Uncharacterized protein n=1 Tax=Trichoderma harzianum CBS 226.95 TaxID=983964 RepID=A0A2T4A1E2_TRIHA|nr:hypothetical protein M431DRAFT_523489 [Trichoderma harzianum CBS 226.95]KAK0766426.1 hypothetical protein N5P37_000149 [Trichoderma harzianum]PKK51848.1 hypothetical protein CI102_5880 [Trichoderma harzianum]PTB50793.1 hypothetical protein M431DRAFT_523489 [Trichoderma harzianum CBS 226.95]